jgi:hypothetical protein
MFKLGRALQLRAEIQGITTSLANSAQRGNVSDIIACISHRC